jgi:hypothetical protein
MIAVIDHSAVGAFGVPAFDGLVQFFALGLHGEVNVKRGAPKGGGLVTTVKVVGGNGAAKGQFQVGVNINCAGQDILASGVHHLRVVGGQVTANHDNFFAVY